AGTGRRRGKELMGDMADRGADHRPDEQARSEDSAGVTRRVTNRRRDDLENGEQRNRLQNQLTAQRPLDLIVSDAENSGDEVAEHADAQASRDGLNPKRGARQLRERGAQSEKEANERHRPDSADDAEPRVPEQLHRT